MMGAITDVRGVLVGHATDFDALTGCTVLLFEGGAIGGVSIPGMASGTRGFDIFRGLHLSEEIHGILLTGGSGFGLDATGGVLKYLEERGIGFEVGVTRVPRVPSAVIFDLALGNPYKRPDKEMGYQACLNASHNPPEQGSVGAGTGATVGKLYGLERAMKGGIGTASLMSPYGSVGALAVVNAFGDVVDHRNGEILAGLLDASRKKPISTVEEMKKGKLHLQSNIGLCNTTLCVVATVVSLSKAEASRLALMAQGALFKTISPVITTFDGDVIFAVSLRKRVQGDGFDLNCLGLYAEEALAQAINNAVKEAKGLGGIPAYRDLLKFKAGGGKGLREENSEGKGR